MKQKNERRNRRRKLKKLHLHDRKSWYFFFVVVVVIFFLFKINLQRKIETIPFNVSQLNAPEWALSALKHSTDFGAKLITYQHYQSNAADIISSSNLSNEQKFSSFVDFQKKNATLIPDQCTLPKCGVNVQNLPKVAKTMTNENVDKLQKDVLNSLADVNKIHDKQFYTHINSCFCGYNRS